MRVRCGDGKLAQSVARSDYPEVVVDEILIIARYPVFDHEAVVAERLYLKIVVEGSYPVEFVVISSSYDGLIQLACFTGASDDEALSVCLQHRTRYPRPLVEIVNMRSTDELVDVFEARLVFRQYYYVIRAVFLYVDGAVRVSRVFVRIEISFDTVNDLYVSSVLGLLRRLLGSVRKGLHDSVVGDGNSRLAPVSRLADYVLHLVEAVVVAHLGMAVKLHPAAVRIGVFLELLFGLLERAHHHEILMLICVILYRTAHPHHVSHGEVLLHLLELVFGYEGLEAESAHI